MGFDTDDPDNGADMEIGRHFDCTEIALPEKRNPANWAGLRGFCIQPLSGKIENRMNDKRFSFKWLGVFRMDAENISPREARRNFWHLVAGICLIITVWKIFTVIELLVK